MGFEAYEDNSRVALERALTETAAYASWRQMDPGPSAAVDARYAALPSSDKAFMRAAFPDGLVPRGKDLADGLARGEVEFVSTSGTTDEQVKNLWNQRWWDFSERSSWKLNEILARVCTGTHREAILTSARNVGPLDDLNELPFESRRLLRFLFLNERSSPLLWNEGTIRRVTTELDRFQPEVLEANPSYLARFAAAAGRMGLEVRQPEVIVFTYENSSLTHLRQIKRVFSAPLVSSYGTTETGYAFVECERGLFHLNMAACRADLAGLGGAGELSLLRLTPFKNEWTALLRFDPGDIVKVATAGECTCGRRGALLLSSIEGRVKSATYTAKGRVVAPGELDRALASEERLVSYQLLQETAHSYKLSAVMEEAPSRGALGRLTEILHGLYGAEARVAVESVRDIAPEPSGKFLLAKRAGSFGEAAP